MKLQPCVTATGSLQTYGLTPTVIAYSLAQKVLIELKTEIFLLLPLASTLVLQLHVDNEILVLTTFFHNTQAKASLQPLQFVTLQPFDLQRPTAQCLLEKIEGSLKSYYDSQDWHNF